MDRLKRRNREIWNYRDSSMPLSVIDRMSSKKTTKAIGSLKNTINQWNLRVMKHLTRAEYTFFSSARGTHIQIYFIQGCKTNLTKFKKIEIIQSMFLDHNIE